MPKKRGCAHEARKMTARSVLPDCMVYAGALLLHHGADIEARTRTGKRPFTLACMHGALAHAVRH